MIKGGFTWFIWLVVLIALANGRDHSDDERGFRLREVKKNAKKLIDPLDELSTVSAAEEDDAIDTFHERIHKIINSYTASLTANIYKKSEMFQKLFRKSRSIGEADQILLIKGWKIASMRATKDRANYTYNLLQNAIKERWRYGKGDRFRKNPFDSVEEADFVMGDEEVEQKKKRNKNRRRLNLWSNSSDRDDDESDGLMQPNPSNNVLLN